MPITKPIETIQKELQDLLVEDIAKALKTLQAMLSSQTDTYSIVISLLARLNEANKARLRGTLENDELNTEYNKIRAAFLELVQGLKETDFESPPEATGEAAPKQGSILYRIPNKMPKDKETKCVVRIALSEDAIVEDITLDEHVQLKELYRVSDTMEAELLDPSGGKKFQIATISDSIQLIDETGFTEWWFYVTPLTEGTHPLVLKVSIIETVDGQPRKKDMVMEETIEVVAEGPVTDAEAAQPKKAGVLNFQTASKAVAGLATGVDKSKLSAKASETAHAADSAATPATKSMAGLLQKVVIGLAVAGTAAIATFVLTPESTRDWWTTRYVEDTVAGYTAYMNEHPTSPYYEPAACRKSILLDTPEAYRDYLIEFPEGACREDAEQALVRLEAEALAIIEKEPTKAAMDAFMVDFPGCENLDALYKIVEKDGALRDEYLPFILQRWEECRRHDPAYPKPPDTVIPGLPTVDQETPTPALSDDSTQPAGTETPVARTEAPTPATTTPTTTPPPSTTPLPPPNMVFVQGGTFQMGLTNGFGDDTLHPVTLRDFFIGRYEVTFEEYDRFCEATNREKPDDKGWGRANRPVINVSWFDAVSYCNWLSGTEGLKAAYTIAGNRVTLNRNANGYRLPTEAEWEYAAKGGPAERDYTFSGSNNVGEVAWYQENSGHQTHPVGHLNSNDLKIFDMSGNVREWCFDWHSLYPKSAVTDPTGPEGGAKRIFRGGFWGRNPEQMQVVYRNSWYPNFTHYGTGFRLARWK
ncbi:MAG: formylglycine-generating enzyme family protein [Lewinellaceae bacterium]|nr:formylglycine-generating enzyme family protein [Lewinellaceae bacterium]